MNQKKQAFFRSFTLSFVICLCLGIGLFGIAKTYENTRQVGFGEYKSAVSFEDGVLQILDFEFSFK